MRWPSPNEGGSSRPAGAFLVRTSCRRSRALLRQQPWNDFRPHPEWVEPSAPADGPRQPYAAGIPGRIRRIYFPQVFVSWRDWKVLQLEPGVQYRATFLDPFAGAVYSVGHASGDEEEGTWFIPGPPVLRDFLLLLEVKMQNPEKGWYLGTLCSACSGAVKVTCPLTVMLYR